MRKYLNEKNNTEFPTETQDENEMSDNFSIGVAIFTYFLFRKTIRAKKWKFMNFFGL